ncbi:hypothetical protein [Natronobacterium texcoconense]|uniref:CARDB protein n=1 Tax=Natronobacterium texcoconense TaxID=1095778 RepID=A0A1H1G069_NATTX|nr:hypothetical protein [Natronobacterium texcoconense]SDR06545.1 hypothetical protein SAMN04489842_2194 [Natronobacterium texcoconense]
MRRRQYLSGVGAGFGIVAVGPTNVGPESDDVSIEILETDSPVEAGQPLSVTAEIENTGSTEISREVELVVGEGQETMSRRIVTLGPGETTTVDSFSYYTFPVREDSEFPVAVEMGDSRAETSVEVFGLDEFDEQYAEPARELTIQPETTVMFEVNTDPWDGGLNWYFDTEHRGPAMSAWSDVYAAEEGVEFATHTFESEGTYDIATTVGDDPRLMTQWEVTVSADGEAPPSIDAAYPERTEVPTEGDYELEVEVSAGDAELDRVIWWMTQTDQFTLSEVSGTTDTATTEGGGCHTCETEAWVRDENNLLTISDQWVYDEDASLDDDTENGDDGIDAVDVTILETNEPITGGETLEVTAMLENGSDQTATMEVALVVGEDPEVVDTRSVSVAAGSTEQVTLEFETYPVEQDDSFPVRVEAAESVDEREVTVYGIGG